MNYSGEITVGLIDSIVVIARVLAERDLSSNAAKDALIDLCEDEHVQALLTSVNDRPALIGCVAGDPDLSTKVKDTNRTMSNKDLEDLDHALYMQAYHRELFMEATGGNYCEIYADLKHWGTKVYEAINKLKMNASNEVKIRRGQE